MERTTETIKNEMELLVQMVIRENERHNELINWLDNEYTKRKKELEDLDSLLKI